MQRHAESGSGSAVLVLRLEYVRADALQNTGQERKEMEQLNQQIKLQSAEHAAITRKCGELERRLTVLASSMQMANSAEQTARQQHMQ